MRHKQVVVGELVVAKLHIFDTGSVKVVTAMNWAGHTLPSEEKAIEWISGRLQGRFFDIREEK